MIDPANYTPKKLVSKSVSFSAWLCMLPLVSTIKCIQKLFNIQFCLVKWILLSLFPDLPTDIKAKTDKAIKDTKQAVQPMVGVLKTAAIR